jgi:integrase/recombinase XerD
MLEQYFVKPRTIDRIRASWIGPEIESYVVWLAEQGYDRGTIARRVSGAVAFGEFARRRGAQTIGGLPVHLDAFVAKRVEDHRAAYVGEVRTKLATEIRSPIEQMLALVIRGFGGTGRPHRGEPFVATVPGFFHYLASERGLRPASIRQYRHHLESTFALLGTSQGLSG